MRKFLKTSTSAFAALALTGTIASANDVEVLHWWTSGGEAAALGVLKDDVSEKGINWVDSPIAGGAGGNAMTVLRARVTSGNPPASVQMLGYDILDWAAEGALANLNATAEAEGWDDVIPAALQQFAKYEGQWVSAPVNVHSVNWVWANKAIFDDNNLEIPTTWDEMMAAMDTLEAAGITPLAQGGQAWQEATMFDSVVMSTGGIDFYRSALIDLDPEALGSDTMLEAFQRMGELRAHVDENFAGREWNLATAMVINGEAAFQVMGDWAKGEFINAGKVPGEDFLCFRFPGTQDQVMFNADQFAMFNTTEVTPEAQATLASSILSPSFQSAFNVVKGSVPARTDVPDTDFDDCGKQGMADLAAAGASDNLVGSMAQGHGAPAAVKNAYTDVVTAFFNGEYDAETAVEELVLAVELAQ